MTKKEKIKTPKAKAVGINHVALEVGDIDQALTFYGRFLDFEIQSSSETAAFIYFGDQFINFSKGRTQAPDENRHFGIAVDNSIHYIYRFRSEIGRIGDYVKTLHYCHANIGRAIFYTAITIIAGFSILMLSNFLPTIFFGVFTALGMAIALLASLPLLPRLILWLRPFGN